jgi:hypothetical protein
MISPHLRLSRIVSAGALSFGLVVGAFGCGKENSQAVEERTPRRIDYVMPVTESTAEAWQEYARTHLPPGMKPGDYLTKERDYPSGDTADVFRTVLDTLYSPAGEKAPLVVLYGETLPRMVGCAKLPCPLLSPKPAAPLDIKTLESFRQATMSRRNIRGFDYHVPIKLVTQEDQRSIVEQGRAMLAKYSPEDPFWFALTERFPGAWGMALLSSAGMNPARTEAVVEVTHHCGRDCRSQELMILRKAGERWQVVERIPEAADSTDMGQLPLRFRGVGARMPGRNRRFAAKADSVRLSLLPREIRGVLTVYPDGGPIPGVTVTAATEDTPNKPWTRVVSDSSGAYVIPNPPVGMAYITVRCPEGTQRPDGLMAVTNVYVELAKPILFNMAIDRRNCDDPGGTPQGIQPPFNAPPMGNAADSARWRIATYPSSDDEAAVYKAVLSGAGAFPADGKITLVYATTKSLCDSAGCADEYYRRIRFEPQVMMSTMDNFLSIRAKRLDLRNGFTGTPGIVLIGDSTLKLLEAAMGRQDIINSTSLIRLAWPTVDKVVQVSPVAFSPHHKQALVELTRGDFNNRAERELWIANKQSNGEWRIVRWFR